MSAYAVRDDQGHLLARVLDSPAELDWQREALCAQVDPDLWFPEKGGSAAEPKRTCLACSVRTECLDYALANGERHGVWGGKSERERRRLLREAEVAA